MAAPTTTDKANSLDMGFYALIGLWVMFSVVFIITNWAESQVAAIAAGLIIAIVSLIPFTLFIAATASCYEMITSFMRR
ncbi:hypothetical protein ACU6U9_02835 [Pseudomonas sp. HK3]